MSKLTVTLPDDLHQQIRLELERQGITTAQFIELAVHNFFEQQKEGVHMATRTMAFQVSEELFQRIKEYLARFEQVYHRKLTQKEFVVSLIESALADADEEFEAALAAQRSDESNAPDDEPNDEADLVECTENSEASESAESTKAYLSNRSKIVRHNAIRAFAKFAYTQDGISYVPDTSKLKNSSTFTPHIFTVEEIRRLLYAADNLPVRNNAPTRHLVIPAVIRLLYCCGFRIGEVLRLRVKDVDLDTGIITVHNGKGGKDRLVPVHNSVIEYLRSYSAQLPDEREWFFPSACGHYSIKTIYDNFRELLFACNIPHTGNGPRVHDFRHTFAVHTLEKQLSDGYDPMVIVPRLAAYLGHKSYRETCWYIHLTVASFPELSQKLDRAFVGIIPVGGETDEEN